MKSTLNDLKSLFTITKVSGMTKSTKHEASKRGHIHTHKLSKGQKAAQLFQAKKLWGNEILSQITK